MIKIEILDYSPTIAMLIPLHLPFLMIFPITTCQHHQAAEEVAGLVVVPDIFCPDTVYHSVTPPPCQDNLPQLVEEEQEQEDDSINPNPVTGLWVCTMHTISRVKTT